jgi:hypothetical protein
VILKCFNQQSITMYSTWKAKEWLHCHVIEWLYKWFGLVIAFIEHLQIVTTRNYSAIANSHTQQFTAARTKSSVCCVFTSCCLVTDSTISSALELTFLPAGDCLTTILLMTYRQGRHRKHRSSVRIPKWSLLSNCLATAVVYKAIT